MKQKFNPLKSQTSLIQASHRSLITLTNRDPLMHRPLALAPVFPSIRCSIVDEAGLVELMSLPAEHRGSLHPAPGYLAFSEQAIKV